MLNNQLSCHSLGAEQTFYTKWVSREKKGERNRKQRYMIHNMLIKPQVLSIIHERLLVCFSASKRCSGEFHMTFCFHKNNLALLYHTVNSEELLQSRTTTDILNLNKRQKGTNFFWWLNIQTGCRHPVNTPTRKLMSPIFHSSLHVSTRSHLISLSFSLFSVSLLLFPFFFLSI